MGVMVKNKVARFFMDHGVYTPTAWCRLPKHASQPQLYPTQPQDGNCYKCVHSNFTEYSTSMSLMVERHLFMVPNWLSYIVFSCPTVAILCILFTQTHSLSLGHLYTDSGWHRYSRTVSTSQVTTGYARSPNVFVTVRAELTTSQTPFTSTNHQRENNFFTKDKRALPDSDGKNVTSPKEESVSHKDHSRQGLLRYMLVHFGN